MNILRRWRSNQATTSLVKWRTAIWEDYDKIIDGYDSVVQEVFPEFGIEYVIPAKDFYYQLYYQGTLFGIVGYIEDKIIAAYVWRKISSQVDVNKMQANELIWYIHKDHQGQGLMKNLLKYVEDQARYNGCTYTDLMLPIYNKGMTKKLSKYGYRTAEIRYIKVLK